MHHMHYTAFAALSRIISPRKLNRSIMSQYMPNDNQSKLIPQAVSISRQVACKMPRDIHLNAFICEDPQTVLSAGSRHDSYDRPLRHPITHALADRRYAATGALSNSASFLRLWAPKNHTLIRTIARIRRRHLGSQESARWSEECRNGRPLVRSWSCIVGQIHCERPASVGFRGATGRKPIPRTLLSGL